MEAQKPLDPAAMRSAIPALGTGIAAALLASLCCVAPLVLVLVGVSGAWMSQLAALERFQPIFLAVAAAALFMAWQKIWSDPACVDGRSCAAPARRRLQKTVFLAGVALFAVVLGFPLVAPWFY